jgi:hypothetical protein
VKLKLAGRTIRLRVEAAGLACDVLDVLGLTSLRDGARLVLSPRWTTDERLPPDQRRPHTPTPKQVLYNPRVDLVRLVATRDKGGRVSEAVAEVTVAESRFVKNGPPFVFPAFDRPLVDGDLHTLDPCPNDWIGLWCREVVDGLCAGEPNVL